MNDMCTGINDLLMPYAFGELDKDAAEMVRIHISECKECRAEYEKILKMKEALKDSDNDVPPDLHSCIMDGVRKTQKEEKRAAFIKKITKFSAVAAVIILSFTIFAVVISQNVVSKKDSGEGPAPHSEAMEPGQPGTIYLSSNNVIDFCGEYNFEFDDGTKVVFEICDDVSVNLCLENKFGEKEYYDGKIEFSERGIILSESNGTSYYYALVDVFLKEGKLFVNIEDGKMPFKTDLGGGARI